jgi:uncharacterized protein (TIGR02594 family)
MSKWYEIAQSKIGTREVPGSKHNEEILKWIRDDLGFDWYQRDEIAWCAGFANWCLKQAGEATTNSLMARSFLNYGNMTKPKEGAILVFKRGTGSQGHVGFYAGETATHFKVLGGNQANAVNIKSYPKSALIGVRWPGRARKSRIVQGGVLAAMGTTGQVVTESAQSISAVADYSVALTVLFVAMTLIGIGMTIYYRIFMMDRDKAISDMGDVG